MSFKPVQPKFSFGRSSGGFGSAAGMVDVAGAFQAQRRNAPKFDELYATGIANRSNERSGIMEAKAAIIGQGMAADAAVESAELLADAQVKAAKAQASAAGQGAVMSGLGGVLGAGISLLTGGIA